MTSPHATTGAAVAEAPVFVTADGGTRRTVRWLGRLLGIALAAWLAAVLAGGTGFTSMPQLPSHIALHASRGGVLIKDNGTHDRSSRT